MVDLAQRDMTCRPSSFFQPTAPGDGRLPDDATAYRLCTFAPVTGGYESSRVRRDNIDDVLQAISAGEPYDSATRAPGETCTGGSGVDVVLLEYRLGPQRVILDSGEPTCDFFVVERRGFTGAAAILQAVTRRLSPQA